MAKSVFSVLHDSYGRRVISSEILESLKVPRSRGLQDSQKGLRTNEALLGAISRGADIAPTVSNPETYFDPGHSIPLGSDDEVLRFTATLPEHRIGTRPERLLSLDSNRTRDFIDGVVSEVGEATKRVNARKAPKPVPGSGSSDSAGSSGE